ncbi:hypothetical protein EHM69_05200 [candidate division KSB1 bacterium]|nr:MAG: hypothetical protein EHM69_05200 [candidate division KSB1 bacterium]
MKLPRALLLSVVLTLLVTLVLSYFLGLHALALFLFLPLGFFFGKRSPRGHDSLDHRKHPGNEPIEPR